MEDILILLFRYNILYIMSIIKFTNNNLTIKNNNVKQNLSRKKRPIDN